MNRTTSLGLSFLLEALLPAFVLPRGTSQENKPPAADYQKEVDRAEWTWHADQANPLAGIVGHLSDYRVEIITPKRAHGEGLTIRVTDDTKDVLSWEGHSGTVLTRKGDVLYIADFHPLRTGCAVVAYHLRANKRLWRAELKGLGPIEHSKYRNAVAISTKGEVVVVHGNEAAGRYIEYVDAGTGKTMAHKTFPNR